MAKIALTFKIHEGDRPVREQTLEQGVIKIGKVPSAHLQLADESVSRMHAIVEVTRDEVHLIDLGSTGGTFVNGQKINKAKLATGDTIQIGKSRIELAIATSVPAVSAVSVVPPPIPVAAKPVTPIAPLQRDEEVLGARAVEVAAMLGDSVVGVKHCMDPRGGKVTRGTWSLIGVGAVALLASAIAFAVAVDNAAFNKGGLEYHTRVLHKPEYSYRPRQLSVAVDFIAFGALGLALGCLTAGLARVRRERKSPYYRIGTAPGVEQPLESAPTPAFPLVAPAGDDFVFNFAPGIEGELLVDGASTPLAELAANGRARPSPTTAGAFELAIPNKGKIRARSGLATFLVTAVAQPRANAAPGLLGVERRTLAYIGGSLAAHLAAVAFLATIPVDDSGLSVVDADGSNPSLVASNVVKEDYPEEKQITDGDDDGERGSESKPAMGLEGTMGKPDVEKVDGHVAIANNKVEPRLSREQAIKQAQTAGVLGSVEAIRGGIASLTATDPFSSGFDVDDIYGPLVGSSGEGRGNFGLGVHDYGPGGGCLSGDCGIVGVGTRYNTISDGKHAGGEYWGPGGNGPGQRRHHAEVPPPTIGTPTAIGGLDKEIIRRYIKRNLNTIGYCYEKELLAKPGIEGEVDAGFLITPNGTVQSSGAKGFDNQVASCIAGVIKNIAFPKPTDGGNVQVNYPFHFHASGAQR
jgi:FHA domain-containing protein